MPTPATHLALAEEMLRKDDLSAAARQLLNEQWGPFLLGSTAPDVRTVSGQRREASHFYSVPRTSDVPAYRALLDTHPTLACVEALSPPRAAFIAGYIAHLVLDELWLDDVFPRFLLQDWGPLRERLFLHNVLRTWIDYEAQEALDGAVAQTLQGVEPRGWVPFVADEHLRVWRDWLVEQLGPGCKMETAEVFASRMGVQPAEIDAVAQSPAQMEELVFHRFSWSALRAFRQKGHEHSVALVDWYVGGLAGGQPEEDLLHLPVHGSSDLRTAEEAHL